MIIGVAGTFGAGKDTVSRYLVEIGFQHESTGDILREMLKEKNIEITRPNLYHYSNVFAKEFGQDFLTKEAIRRKKSENLIISGIRSAGEVDNIKLIPESYLVFVDAPVDIRYNRITGRGREDENKISLEEFKNREEAEMVGNKGRQNINYCKEQADYIINNDSDWENLHKQVDKILEKIKKVNKN